MTALPLPTRPSPPGREGRRTVPGSTPGWTRRGMVAAGAAAVVTLTMRPGFATEAERDTAMREFAGETPIKEGRVTLDMPPLVENGNAAPLTISVESPMSEADHVRRIGIFNEKNQQPHVLTVQIGLRAGRAQLSTRVRLANSQRLVALAEMSDGSVWSGTADVIVTLAACVEG